MLDAAADLLEREGPESLSVRRISTEAGVAPMGIYNHYASKAGIVDALVRRGFEDLGAAFASVASSGGDAVDATRRLTEFAAARPRTFELMFFHPAAGPDLTDEPPSAAAAAAAAIAALADLVARTARAGDTVVPRLRARALVALVAGWVALRGAERDATRAAVPDAIVQSIAGKGA